MTSNGSELDTLGFTAFFASQLPLDADREFPARVVGVERSGLLLQTPDRSFTAPLGSRWFQDGAEHRPTVGDWVRVEAGTDRPLACLERQSLFQRRAVDGDVQLVAANVDVALLVSACNREFNVARLERYLAITHEAGAQPVVVLTKADEAEDPWVYADQVRALDAALPVEVVNGLDPGTLDGVRAWCAAGTTVALLGSSGVGKSTLVNGLAGRALAETGAAREADARGRHTTTQRALNRLPEGAWVLDSPGMRELGLVDAEAGLRTTFAEIEELARACRFGDCAHEGEPGCAVAQAIENGELDAGRLQRYRKLLREERHATESIAARRARHRQFEKHVRRVVGAKQSRRR